MRRLALSALSVAALLAVVSLSTASGSEAHRPYSVATVKAAFAAEGVRLQPFRGAGAKPARWVTLIGKWPHRVDVNVRLGPYRGRYNHLTYAPSAPGSDRAQYRNVLIAWRPRDWAVVRGALHRLK
jgi:hypothetical protein